MKRICSLILIVGFIFGFVGDSFGMCGMCDMSGHKAKAQEESIKEKTAEKVNNKICPVSGEAVDMKNPVTYEHKGKVYNFCCGACIDGFKKDPEKYIKIIEEEKVSQEHSAEKEHHH